MNIIAANELKSLRKLRERLERKDAVLVTNNGRPMAIMMAVENDEDPDDLLRATREARSKIALSRVRDAARRSGSANMTAKQIDELIFESREERKATE